jgi:hypothetical protein
MVAGTFLSEQSVRKKNETAASTLAKAQAEKMAEDRQREIDYFNQNSTQILSQIEELMTKQDFGGAASLSSRYLVSGNPELIKLNEQAKTRQREKLTQGVLALLEDVSATDLQKNWDFYQQLVTLNPGDPVYANKLKVFSEKLKQKEEQEREAQKNSQRIAEANQIITQAEQRFRDNRESLKKYYATPEQVKQAQADILALTSAKIVYGVIGNNQEERIAGQKAASLIPSVSRQAREMYASVLEETMVKNGWDVKVRALGADKNQLRVSYALMSQPLVYQLQNKEEINERASSLGFTKLVYTDGFQSWLGHTWTIDLRQGK